MTLTFLISLGNAMDTFSRAHTNIARYIEGSDKVSMVNHLGC